jgi:hypothetical protein
MSFGDGRWLRSVMRSSSFPFDAQRAQKGREIFYCGSAKTQRKFAAVLHALTTSQRRRACARKAPVQLRQAR